MATFGDLSTEIQTDVGGRTDNALKAVVDRAINRAVADYEQHRFSFNQGIDTSLNSVVNQGQYTLPATMLSVKHVQFLSSGDLDYLERWTYERYLREITDDTNLVGEPSRYAIFGRLIFVYPEPNEVAPFTISGVIRLANTPFTDDAQENAWTNEGASLIRARAKWDIYTNTMKNVAMAAVNARDVTWYLRQLRSDLEVNQTVGQIPVHTPF